MKCLYALIKCISHPLVISYTLIKCVSCPLFISCAINKYVSCPIFISYTLIKCVSCPLVISYTLIKCVSCPLVISYTLIKCVSCSLVISYSLIKCVTCPLVIAYALIKRVTPIPLPSTPSLNGSPTSSLILSPTPSLNMSPPLGHISCNLSHHVHPLMQHQILRIMILHLMNLCIIMHRFKESWVSIMAFCVENSLTYTATDRLIELLRKHCPADNKLPQTRQS